MKQSTPLNSAPLEVQLAVDLIYLLESNNVRPDVALKAIELVSTDLKHKLANYQDSILTQSSKNNLSEIKVK
jgi:hypothetical protein